MNLTTAAAAGASAAFTIIATRVKKKMVAENIF